MYIRLKGLGREPESGIVIMEIPIEDVIEKLVPLNMAVTSVSLIMKKDKSEIAATANCIDEEDELYPSLSVSGCSNDMPLEATCTELPNEDHDHIVTYLFPGKCEQERDDWIVSIHDGTRQKGDTSRRVIYVDEALTTGISARIVDGNTPTPVTEEDADKRGLSRIF